ncbi:MAG: hypothetical protein PHH82_01220 [Candidatus ainarchaeum sp.]|nr:hypothetical protein [Candidatus ainarchaeum sp.]
MKVTTAQILSIFVIVIMLASVIGVSFIGWGDKEDSDALPTVDYKEPDIKEAYYADLNGIIKERSDEILIIADTNELDITKLDNSIRDLSLVKYIISSNYNTENSKIAYVANIKLKEKEYDMNFIESLNNTFETYQLYPTQILSFTNPIHMVAKDSNKTLDYDLGYTELKIITETSTLENDSITARFEVMLQKGIPIQIFAYEVYNFSAQPILFSNEKDVDILDLSLETNIYAPDVNVSEDLVKTYFSDYNYEIIPDNNINYTKITTTEANDKVGLFLQDYNSFKATKSGKIFVNSIDYNSQTYTYDQNVDVIVPYDLNPEIPTRFTISGYLYRGEIVQVFAYVK